MLEIAYSYLQIWHHMISRSGTSFWHGRTHNRNNVLRYSPKFLGYYIQTRREIKTRNLGVKRVPHNSTQFGLNLLSNEQSQVFILDSKHVRVKQSEFTEYSFSSIKRVTI